MPDDNFDDLYNSEVVDRNGKKIGGVGQVYLDDKTGQPTWVTVKTGLFGTKENFVPLVHADIASGRIRVPYPEGTVKDAPTIDPDRHLDADEEADLYKYYGITTIIPGGEPETDAVSTAGKKA
ncbi:PRC-barrel domain-containing protein [Propionibacterium sp.]|uniref:PRC-barrel domain-containing protein n=1 Tax=Propionibacterium sp. TaxID=1977903 RepID=UPI0039ECA25A